MHPLRFRSPVGPGDAGERMLRGWTTPGWAFAGGLVAEPPELMPIPSAHSGPFLTVQ